MKDETSVKRSEAIIFLLFFFCSSPINQSIQRNHQGFQCEIIMSSSSSKSMLTSAQKYSAGALFGLALYNAQTRKGPNNGHVSDGTDAESDDHDTHRQLWIDESTSLLYPIFKFLEIDEEAWRGLVETAVEIPAKDHVGAFLKLLTEDENGETLPEANERELALANGVDSVSSSMEKTPLDYDSEKLKQCEYEQSIKDKFKSPETTPESVSEEEKLGNEHASVIEPAHKQSMSDLIEKPLEEAHKLPYPKKITVLYELVSATLANEDAEKSPKQRKGYDARHRVALRLLATWLDVKWTKMESIETIIASSAMALIKEEHSNEEGEQQSLQSSWDKWKRGGIIGAAALTGGTLMAITGGLAAPAIASGFTALAPTLGAVIPGFAAVASATGSVVGSAAVAASFGAAGAGLSGTKMARRIGDVEEFEFKAVGENHNKGRLGVEISISGFVFKEEDFARPFEEQHDNSERYVLQWESKNLIALSNAIQDWLTSKIAGEMMKQGAMLTVLSTLVSALAWPTKLLSLADLIDSKWSIAIDRSDKAGKLLAEVLVKGLQGHRPVTLVGFSLGARMIFKCLQILAESESNAGIVERVVLLGAPVAIKDMDWEAARKVVAGRFVNVYSTNDWMLGVAFRANLLAQGLAGIQRVDLRGIENVDVTELIDGHSSYLWRTQEILNLLQLDSYNTAFNRIVFKS